MNLLRKAMPRYEAYKDSGVEWLGEIPQKWSIEKVKNLTINKDGKRIPLSGNERENFKGTIPYYGASGIIDYVKEGIFFGKHILIGEDGAPFFDKHKQVAFIADREFWVNNHCHVLKAKENCVDLYVMYCLNAVDYECFIKGSTRDKLNQSDLSNIILPYPSKTEQTAIASFLDRKSTKIDQAIAIKEQQIALLKERKQILIQNAVTRGLDPDAPMRDSGVEWIGEIPGHWEVKRAKFLFVEVNERSASGKEELLSVSHTTGVTPRSEKNVNMFMAEDYTGSKTCQKDDLVINIMWAWMGAFGVSDRHGIVSSSYGVFRQKKKDSFNPKYLELLLKTTKYIEHYNKISTGLHSSRLRFYPHMFFDMELGYPDRHEQTAIVAHIETQSTKIDNAIALQQRQIEKLREYKATLINSAVTGKIKVLDGI